LLLNRQFIRTAKRYGRKPAFIDRTTDKRITYSKALIFSLVLSEKFKKYGDSRIGIMLPTGAGCALSILGSLMAGKSPVMVNYTTGAARNAEYAKRKCGFGTIITSRAFLEKLNCPRVDGMVHIEDLVGGITLADKLKALLRSMLPTSLLSNAVHGGSEEDDAVMLFTSGSEKDPKAVPLTHKNILSNIESITGVFALSDADRMLANLPFFHVFGLTVNLWTPLCHGMTVVTYANPMDYKTVCNIVREERPTIMAGTPSFFLGYLRKSEPGDFESLRIMVSGADKCPQSLRDAFREKHGISLLEGYGVTETSPVISTNTPWDNRQGSIGRVIPGARVRIENLESGGECAPGETGKITVKGDLVMKGYFGDPEETSRRIKDGWYDTGDMGFVDKEGYLYHAGRLKRFVKVGGEMVSLSKVEDVLERFLPQDASCCVVEAPDELRGAKIVAAVTLEVDEKKILRQMAGHLPNIALPKRFVRVEELPRMGSGKVDFRATAEMVRGMIGE
jgi:acyl-[acyl-carrier-protein]-phospholipid O-acyltransferase/long-chain-fatty-acid--[acyl-carrier-protein] ligase